MIEFHEYDVASMARLVCFAKSPLAKGFITMFTGKKEAEIKRSDLDCIASDSPGMLVSLALGGKEVFMSLRIGALEFDKYFDGSDYTIPQMENAVLSMNVRNTVFDFYSAIKPESFFKKHMKWIIGGAGIVSCIIAVFVVIHVRKQKQSFSHVSLKRKRDAITAPSASPCEVASQPVSGTR
jgi:hypothetical protein